MRRRAALPVSRLPRQCCLQAAVLRVVVAGVAVAAAALGFVVAFFAAYALVALLLHWMFQ